MNAIETIQKAADWVRENRPNDQFLTVGVCLLNEYMGMPEVYVHGWSVVKLFPGSECHFIRDKGYTLGYNIVVKDGVVIRSCDLCGENDEDRKFIIPSEVSANPEIVAEVL